uniref:Uncharacterized protein n=1 Tax=Malurus cyaneus samueli TaxID=2593467 RepID=A0A8C5U9H6_9PASS
MYPESTTDSPARLSLRQTGSPGMIYSCWGLWGSAQLVGSIPYQCCA